MQKKDWLIALLVVAAWGFNFVVIHWGLEELPPLLLGALRFLLVAFPAVLFIKPPKLPLRWLLAYGFTISFLQFALLFSAMQLGMPAGLASLVLQAQAIFTLLFALLFLGEAFQLRQLLALLIAAAGLWLLASQSGDSNMTLIGFSLTIAAAAAWGAGNVINRKIGQRGDVNLVSLVVWAGLTPPLPFFAASWMLEGPDLILDSLAAMSWQSAAVLFYLAAIATLFGYGSWAWLLKHHPASTIAPLTLLVPVFGLLSAWLLLDEQLNGVQLGGILLVMTGLLVNSFGGYLSGASLRKFISQR